MNLKYLMLCIFVLCNVKAFSFENYKLQYLIIETNALPSKSQIGYNLLQTQDTFKKNAYILNVSYKVNGIKSSIGADANFIFVFYVFPKAKDLKLVEVSKSDSITEAGDISNIRNILIHTSGSIDDFNFIPLIRYQNKLYKFKEADIFGQAFNLKEKAQYFPDYAPLMSNRYELNLLGKPYTEQDIEAIQNKMKTDTSGMKHFEYDGFDGKWNIKAINKSEKTFDFWIRLIRVATGSYSFGRFANEIKFKLNVGVIGFKVEPLKPLFDEPHAEKYRGKSVPFAFKNFVDIKSVIH